MVADLTLEKAVTIARQSEAVQQQQRVVRGIAGIVDSVEAHKTGKKVQNKQFPPVQTPPSKPPQKQTCSGCGRFPAHSRQKCPTNNETCLNSHVEQEKLHTWKWILMTKVHTWKWNLMYSLQSIPRVTLVTIITPGKLLYI